MPPSVGTHVPSLHSPPSPVSGSVHALPSSNVTTPQPAVAPGVGLQTGTEHPEGAPHALLSGLKTQPLAALQLSIVHAMPSLQVMGADAH